MTYVLFVTGCQQNIYDSKRIAHLLTEMGYVLGSEKNADVIVVLSCSVRQKPIDRIWGKLKNWHNLNPRPKIIVTGCLLPSDKIKMIPKIDAFIPANEMEEKLPNLLLNYFPKNCDRRKKGSKLEIRNCPSRAELREKIKIRKKSCAFVPIMYGCNNFCSYCAVPFTRGRERSRPMEEIIAEIKNLVKNGTKEVTLLGQNVNSFKLKAQNSNVKTTRLDSEVDPRRTTQNLKVKDDFVKLLEQIEKIQGLKKISFLTSHPKDMSDDLVGWMAKSKKFSRELHLPLQSGDDEILLRMNRNYTADHFLKLIINIKSQIPNIKLTTDIIVGFPNETKKQFENTYDLCKKIGFYGAYISQYSPRSGTVSAKMADNVPPTEKKRRWKILNNLINKNSIKVKGELI